MVGEGVLGPGLLEDFDGLCVVRAVALLVLDGRAVGVAERLGLPRLVAAAEADLDPSAAEVVEDRQLLGQAQGVPEGDDVGELAEANPRGERGDRRLDLDRVGAQLGALGAEVVLGQPVVVEADLLGEHRASDLCGLQALGRLVQVVQVPVNHTNSRCCLLEGQVCRPAVKDPNLDHLTLTPIMERLPQ